MSPRRVRVSMHYKSVPRFRRRKSLVSVPLGVWLLSNRKTERFDCVVGSANDAAQKHDGKSATGDWQCCVGRDAYFLVDREQEKCQEVGCHGSHQCQAERDPKTTFDCRFHASHLGQDRSVMASFSGCSSPPSYHRRHAIPLLERRFFANYHRSSTILV
jgi:hypothetical protein